MRSREISGRRRREEEMEGENGEKEKKKREGELEEGGEKFHYC